MKKHRPFSKSFFFYSCTVVVGATAMFFTEANDLHETFNDTIHSLSSIFYLVVFAYIICVPLWLVILPYFGVFGNWQKNFSTHTLIYLNGSFGLLVSLVWALVFSEFNDLSFFLPFIVSACVSGILTALKFSTSSFKH